MGGFTKAIGKGFASVAVKKAPEVTPPKVSQDIQKAAVKEASSGPTAVEMSEDSLKTKRRGRRATILTGPEGLGTSSTLGKKTLLGGY
tara:strand:+ start:1887 stop:2150 length:264 start_codon:yes stop_codon:yes gene_type:complete